MIYVLVMRTGGALQDVNMFFLSVLAVMDKEMLRSVVCLSSEARLVPFIFREG